MKLTARLFHLVAIVGILLMPATALPYGAPHELTVAAPGQAAPTLPRSPVELVPFGLGLLGAIRVKDTASLAKKFVSRAGAAGNDYTEGVKNAGADWEANTRASGDNWAAGVQQAIGDKRFDKGVAEAGSAKYVARASTLGAQRFPTGVAAAEQDWNKGTQPYLDVIRGLNLPARRPKGDPANMQRANAVAAALRAKKIGG